MDWDGNQDRIRKALNNAETLADEMVYENDPEARGKLYEQVSRELFDVLKRTENMTRRLNQFASIKLYRAPETEEVGQCRKKRRSR